MHQIKCCGIKADRCVIDRRTADLEQFALAVRLSLLFSLRIISWRSDGLIALVLVTKIIFHRQLTDLGVQIFDLAFFILSLLDLV